ncbi:MAG: ketopantoate reductase family protein [Brachymonas sp.]
MKIAILGAGSLGSALGGVLAEQGHEVWLITRNADHVTAIRERGLILRTDGADRTVRLQASTNASEAGVVDGVIILVKSAQTLEATLAAKSSVGDASWVMSLQNGLGHEEVLAQVFGKERVLAGKTYCGGQMIASGHVICGVQGKDTHIGELAWNRDGAISERLRGIAQAFNDAGITTQMSDNIEGAMWDKLFINVATGALSGITRLPYGLLYQVPELAQTATLAVREAMSVAAAKGVRFGLAQPIDAWHKAGAGLPYEFKASILQTLERGMRTEIDYINGAVVRYGAQLGIAMPVNSSLVACIKGIEKGMFP